MNVYILEDQWAQQVHLEKTLHEIEAEHKLAPLKINLFSNTTDFLNSLPSPSVENLFLLDLEINGDNLAGLKISQRIRQNDLFASIIFITVHNELLPTTYNYESEALDFIAKDQDDIKGKLTKDLLHVANKLAHFSTPTITLKVTSGFLRVSLDDIVYFEPSPTNTHQSLMHTVNNQVTTINANLNQLIDRSPLFFRTHKHCLINLSKVSKIDTHNHLVTLNGAQHPQPLSRLKNKALLSKLGELNDQFYSINP